jgi:glutaconate CoA-transferase subunit A
MREKVLSLNEAAGWVQNGALLGFTCHFVENAPMAFIREVVRRQTRDLRVATLPGGGLHVDFLIGAGAVSEYETCHCSLGEYGAAPNFQRALRRRSIQMKDNT